MIQRWGLVSLYTTTPNTVDTYCFSSLPTLACAAATDASNELSEPSTAAGTCTGIAPASAVAPMSLPPPGKVPRLELSQGMSADACCTRTM